MAGVIRWRPRWYEFAPEALLALGLGLFAVTEFRAATSGLMSVQAIVLMTIVGSVWVVTRVALWRFAPWPVVRMIPFFVGALVILKVVVLPAYNDKTVIETLPTVPAVTTTAPAATTVPSAPTVPSATTVTTAPPVTESAAPVLLRTGSFRGIDHRAEGTVNIYRQADGTFLVGLEDIDIQPGPDYDVYVVPGADKESRSGGLLVDDLRGNKGTQFYTVADVNLEDGPWTVLVWCDTFAVPIASATPA